ncbi:MAG: Cof-type HAD-IIB family hydrolase [Aerococcus sp.]|nr:Cof-type HAD-IIB family hydrolase [Aerococcus sp.]
MSIRLVAIDLDGSLLTTDKQLSGNNIDMIHRVMESGVQVVICTGRSLPGVRRFIKQLNFKGDEEYMILQNGASTYHLPDYRLVDDHTIKRAGIEAAFDYLAKYPDLEVVALSEEKFYYTGEDLDDRMAFEAITLDSPAIHTTRNALKNRTDLYKLIVMGKPKFMEEIIHSAPARVTDEITLIHSLPDLIEFIPHGINKAVGLKRLCEHLHIQPEEVMAIGDEHNDIEMLEFVGLGVAMGNANERVKAVANDVTAKNDDDGVALALKKWLL